MRIFSVIAASLMLAISVRGAETNYDLVIYGGTGAAITAAIEAKEMGLSVVIVSPDLRIGGMTTGGLGATDFGAKGAIGGLSRQFYEEMWKYYQDPAAWTAGEKEKFTLHVDKDAWWHFEPHAALEIYRRWIKEHGIEVVEGKRLDRESGVKKEGARIVSIAMESGEVYAGRTFIDATYEGDLMAAAGVSYTVTREANRQYGETINGYRPNTPIEPRVDPYVVPGKPESGLIAGIHRVGLPAPEGSEAPGVQAYNYRLCLTDNPENQVAFEKPADYDPARYELLFRMFEAGYNDVPIGFGAVPNRKTDSNNGGAGFSTDYVGANWEYPEASYEERERIIADHISYTKGFLWALANEPRVPESVRAEMNRWGLAKDEFTENGNWPTQLYVREARRMVSDEVLTEAHCRGREKVADPVGMGSYTMDGHCAQRYVDKKGRIRNEGGLGGRGVQPYGISYRSIVPRAAECDNLLVPVCPSASHVAFGSLRMEPVYMILGQSAGAAAALAVKADAAVQAVDYVALRARLDERGQALAWPPPMEPITGYEGIIVDDMQAERIGPWQISDTIRPVIGMAYHYSKGSARAVFTPELPKAGRYEVRLAYSASGNRAPAVRAIVTHAGGKSETVIDQTKRPPIARLFISLGEFEFAADGARVEIVHDGAGVAAVDAVQFIPR